MRNPGHFHVEGHDDVDTKNVIKSELIYDSTIGLHVVNIMQLLLSKMEGLCLPFTIIVPYAIILHRLFQDGTVNKLTKINDVKNFTEMGQTFHGTNRTRINLVAIASLRIGHTRFFVVNP